LYKIVFPTYTTNDSLLNSITKTNIIKGSTITDDYKSITFQALSVKTLPQYLSYLKNTQNNNTFDIKNSLKMIFYLSNQLKYLINNEEKCFYRYNPNKILIIDETKFMYLSNEDLLKIEPETKNIEINTVISLDWFVSPEILKITSIPERVHYKTIYYSLGALIIYSLYSINILDIRNDISNEIEQIEQIKGTKLYYFLKRCLNKTVENRSLLYF